MLGRLVGSAVLELDAGVFPEGEKVGEEEAVGGFEFVVVAFRFFGRWRATGMTREGQGHVSSSPVIAAAAPFFGAGALGLGRLAVVEEETRIAFEGVEDGVMG